MALSQDALCDPWFAPSVERRVTILSALPTSSGDQRGRGQCQHSGGSVGLRLGRCTLSPTSLLHQPLPRPGPFNLTLPRPHARNLLTPSLRRFGSLPSAPGCERSSGWGGLALLVLAASLRPPPAHPQPTLGGPSSSTLPAGRSCQPVPRLVPAPVQTLGSEPGAAPSIPLCTSAGTQGHWQVVFCHPGAGISPLYISTFCPRGGHEEGQSECVTNCT